MAVYSIKRQYIVREESTMNTPNITMIMIPEEEWRLLKENPQEILFLLKEIKSNSKIASVPVGHVKAKEFLESELMYATHL